MSFDLREAIPKLYENQGNPNFADFIREVRFLKIKMTLLTLRILII